LVSQTIFKVSSGDKDIQIEIPWGHQSSKATNPLIEKPFRQVLGVKKTNLSPEI
jgi:hypothetical protein